MEPVSTLEPQKTVLIVDDDAVTLSFVAGTLADKYHVLTATSGEALEQSNGFKTEIHLLLSDFQMKGITGIDLANQLTAQRPNIKVLLMSGYSGGMLVLNEGWHFLPKPFIPSQLRTLVAGLISPAKSRFDVA